MPPSNPLFDALRDGPLLSEGHLREAEALARHHPTAAGLAAEMVRRGWLTPYQGKELAEGRGFALAVGSCVLLDKLGEGGMGEVFRARHKVLHCDVALKRINARYIEADGAAERFLREARALARLSHENVVSVRDAGEADGVLFLTMELLDGVDLAKHLRQRKRLPSPEALDYVRQACLGMQHAHEKGLVHRDLKPGNLFLTGGKVKILDLGLVLMSDAAPLTAAEGTFGTVDYMAPEQVIDSHEVDVRADVYSLGCILYHFLTGRTPFQHYHPSARASMHRGEESPPPVESLCPEVPAGVAAVVRKMMAKRREDRHATPGEAAAELGRVAGLSGATEKESAGPKYSTGAMHAPPLPEPVPAERYDSTPPTEMPATTRVMPKRRRSVLVGAVLLLAGLAAAAAFALPWGGRGPKVAEVPKADEPPKEEVKPPPEAEKDKKPVVPPVPPMGDSFVNGLKMRFVRVKAGEFAMGSPEDEAGRDDKAVEKSHRVRLGGDYFLCVTEVTQRQYREVMNENPSYFRRDGPGKKKIDGIDPDDLPVESVSWMQAKAFLAKLNARKDDGSPRVTYRLPTEAEWEYACRGGHSRDGGKRSPPFHLAKPSASLGWGDARFNAALPYGGGKKGETPERPAPVGTAGPPNALGLFDMHGNVWEWCEDWFGEEYYGAAGAGDDPKGPAGGEERSARGGCWDSAGLDCRAAIRRSFGPNVQSNFLGFRVAASPAE